MQQDTTPIIWDDPEPVQVPVKFRGRWYVLVEPTAADVAAFKNQIMKGKKMGTRGTAETLDGMGDSEPILVSYCLYEANAYPDGTVTSEPPLPDMKRRVPYTVIKGWPGALVSRLADRAKELAGLVERQTIRVKVEDGPADGAGDAPAAPEAGSPEGNCLASSPAGSG